jgi:hypothetical protein
MEVGTMSEQGKELHVGNKTASIFVSSATAILDSVNTVRISGLGNAMVPCAKLSLILEGLGYPRTTVCLEKKDMPGRALDPSDPDALRKRKFVATGHTQQVPKLTITHVKYLKPAIPGTV